MNIKKFACSAVLVLALALSTGMPVWGSYIIPNGSITTAKLATAAVTQAILAARATGSTVGAGGVAMTDCGSTSTTSGGSGGAFVAWSGCTVTITTTGRPIMVIAGPDSATGSSIGTASASALQAQIGQFSIAVGSNQIAGVQTQTTNSTGAGNNGFPINFSTVYVVGAGTYTFNFYIRAATATTTAYVNSMELTAYEL